MPVPDERSAAIQTDATDSMTHPASAVFEVAPSNGEPVGAFRADAAEHIPARPSPEATVAGMLAGDQAVLAATFFDAAVRELAHEMHRDHRIVALVAHELIEGFLAAAPPPDRLHGLPAATRPEEMRRALGWCRRLARAGRRPHLVVDEETLHECFGQLREELCATNTAFQMIVVSGEPAGNGECRLDCDRERPTLAFLRLLPHAAIMSPRDGRELRQMLRLGARCARPVALHVPRGPLPNLCFPDFVDELELGKAEILEDGEEVVLLALGALVAPAVAAARELSHQGISAGVVNARFVEPLDRGLIGELARGTKGIVVLEEESAAGGFGSAVLELLADSGIHTPVAVSGAVGISRNGRTDGGLATQIGRQALALVERADRIVPAERRSARIRRAWSHPGGPDLFGFSIESVQRERDLVKARRLSPEVEEWFQIYSLAGERQRFLWQWCEQGAELTTLPCVPPGLFPHVCQTKVLSIMLCVLLDDVADQRDRETFLEVLLKIVDGELSVDVSDCTRAEQDYAEITRRLAEVYFARVRNYPSFDTYNHLLRYDQFQYFNTMRYSQMLNRNLWLMNPVEHDLYLPHAMDMMSFATLDLMCTPEFPIDELGRLREALWHLQCMGRVGNLLSTWRREIRQQDFTSGVFARAVIEGDLSVGQLRPDNYGEIEKAIIEGGHERYYFGRWKYHRECFLARARQVTSVDLNRLLEGNDRFFLMHLGGRGLI